MQWQLQWHITFEVGDVLPARIRACVARPGLAKCGGRNCHKGAKRRLAIFGTRRARTAPGALTVCYAPVLYFSIYFFSIFSLLLNYTWIIVSNIITLNY